MSRCECFWQDVRRSGALCPLGSAQEQEPAERGTAWQHGEQIARPEHLTEVHRVEKLAGDPAYAEIEQEENRNEDQKLDQLAARNVHVFHSKNSFFTYIFCSGVLPPAVLSL